MTTTHTLRGEGFDASEDGTGRGTPLVPVVGVDGYNGALTGQVAATMGTRGSSETASGPQVMVPVPFDTTQVTSATNRCNPQPGDPCHPLAAGAHAPAVTYAVRTANTSANGHGVAAEVTHTLDQAQGQAIAFHPTQDPISSTNVCHSIGANGQATAAVAVALRGREGGATAELGDEVQNCLRASSGGGDKPHVLTAMQVRRLTPTECERLQGFPDGYTLVPNRGKPMADGPRYKALGNSWAVPVVRWIGWRIAAEMFKDLA